MSHLWGDLSCHFDCYRRGTQITEFFLYFATSVSNTLIFNIGSTTPLTATLLNKPCQMLLTGLLVFRSIVAQISTGGIFTKYLLTLRNIRYLTGFEP